MTKDWNYPALSGCRKEEAARSLADMARDAVRKSQDTMGRQMAIEVRDDNGPVLQVKFTFEIDRRKC